MRQFMQARLFALTDAVSVVRSDLDPAVKSVSAADSLSTHHGYGVGVCQERSFEPVHLLDGMEVARTVLNVYYAIVFDQYFGGQLADWQARRKLSVIRCCL
jgi:hypothetical protein